MNPEIMAEIEDLFRGDNRKLAPEIITLVEKFRPYWPMTLRAFYYQAVAALLVENNAGSYTRIGKLMATMRRNLLLPWKAMEDKTRITYEKRGLSNVAVYIEDQLNDLLEPEYYGRCYIQEQEMYVEVSVEKDAISDHVRKAVFPFCTRVNVTKGQPSATMVNSMAERFEAAINRGKEPILLHYGDLDPTGVQIPKSIQSALWTHHDIEVDVRNVGLTPNQCIMYDLPQSLDAANPDDPNIDRWYEEYGDQAPTEIDALHPRILMDEITGCLESVYDMSCIDEEKEKEAEERELLREMRDSTIEHLNEAYPDEMKEAGYL